MTATLKTTVIQEPSSATANMTLGTDGSIGFQAGTAAAPIIAASGDTNTGLFFPAADTVAVSTGGLERLRVASAGQIGIGGATYGTSGQLLVSGGASSAPAWTSSKTLLGTISTASGASVSLSVSLTSYSQLLCAFDGVSQNGTTRSIFFGTSTANDVQITEPLAVGNDALSGLLTVDLTTGVASFAGSVNGTTSNSFGAKTPVVNASTTISFAVSGAGQAFDAGSINVYGIL